MKKFLTAASLLLLSYSGFSALEVEWIDGNTIRVSGDGYSVVTNIVYTNSLGTCTNCIQVSPEQMSQYKSDIHDNVVHAKSYIDEMESYANELVSQLSDLIDEIGTYQRFATTPVNADNAVSNYIPFTNYLETVMNSQTILVNEHRPNSSSLSGILLSRWAAYNNGIYDYAKDIALPNFRYQKDVLNDYILSELSYTDYHLDEIDSIVRSIPVDSCSCSGDGAGTCPTPGGGGSPTTNGCPCVEQLDAIKNYVEHIDDDQHMRFEQLNQISNNVFNLDAQLDSYAKLVSGILYNDGTIVVDDGANSWTNVYRRGYSDLYDYDRSNILQRIELLLFGLSSPSSSTNWGDVGEIATGVSSATSVEDADVQSVNDTISDQLDGIGDHFDAMFDALNFFGSGSLNNFSLNDPTTVFGVYDFEVESSGVDDLANFRNLCRTCFQIVYWCGGIAFLVFFWYFVISFVVRHVLFFIRFFNNLLT